MKLTAHPLVVAAALGLVGPAAVADETDNPFDVAGLWTRTSEGEPVASALGHTIELIPLDDQLMVMDGGRSGSWHLSSPQLATQTIVDGDTLIERKLEVVGTRLAVESTVTRNGVSSVERLTYHRAA